MTDDPNRPPIFTQPPEPATKPTGIDAMIPTKNGDALLSYYTGLFAIIPLFGLVLGTIALLRGKVALANVKSDSTMPGKTHACVGIGCGTIGLIFNLLILALIIGVILNPK